MTESRPWYLHMQSVGWAVAARDAATERRDKAAARTFARESREAIAAACEAAGVSLDELAEQLDYPGGAAAIDGPHVDLEISEMTDAGPAFPDGPQLLGQHRAYRRPCVDLNHTDR